MSSTTTSSPRKFSLGMDRFSGLYVWGALIIVFGALMPSKFLTFDTFKTVAGQQSIGAIVALGLIIPVAAGAFDLSIAGVVGMSSGIMTWFMMGHPAWLFSALGDNAGWVGIPAALAFGALIGLLNALVVVKLKVDSFIGTLGMSSILIAGTFWITNGQQISLSASKHSAFLAIGRTELPLGINGWAIPLPVIYMLVFGAILWWVLEYTPAGRYLYAVGGNPQAARLAGVRVDRITTMSFVASGMTAALAGIILLSRIAITSPDTGQSYLLPAFSAVFLGATQIRPGRVNVIGTLIAIFLLATGVKGLLLLGAPQYITDLFNGVALILAVALAARTARKRG